MLERLALLILGGAVGGICLLWLLQDRLIYHPRRYAPEALAVLPASVMRIEFRTPQGAQTAFLRRGDDGDRGFWLAFSGNGSLALDWLPVLPPGPTVLLVDYPGYGLCEGRPDPSAIDANAAGAVAAAPASAGRPCAVLGYSLGCAAALRFAAAVPVERVVLLAPFTSMDAMARRSVGPLAFVLRHRFDNTSALHAALVRSPDAQVTVLHGANDLLVPPAMGRALAAEWPGARYEVAPGATHDGLPGACINRLASLMGPRPTQPR